MNAAVRQKVTSRFARGVIVGATLVLALGFGGVAFAAGPGSPKKPGGAAAALVGAWQVDVTFTSNPPPSIPSGEETAVQAFNRDGVHSIYTTGGRTAAYGVWAATDKARAFRYTFHELSIRPDGVYVGYVVVNQTGTVSKDGTTYTSSGTGQFHNPAGVPVGPPSQTRITGTRIELE